MRSLDYYNSRYFNYLSPLLKWKVLDLESLRNECIGEPNYFNFAKHVRKLEKFKVVNGYFSPINRRKYIYLNTDGEKVYSDINLNLSVKKENLVHDILVSQVARSLLSREWVEKVVLEHEFDAKGFSSEYYNFIPDALFFIKKNQPSRIAFELELTRKSKNRIIEKAEFYNQSEQTDYVIYLFGSENLQKSYSSLLSLKKLDEKYFFIYCESLTSKNFNLDNSTALYQNEVVSTSKLFKTLNSS